VILADVVRKSVILRVTSSGAGHTSAGAGGPVGKEGGF
jgi:hypothetical protein